MRSGVRLNGIYEIDSLIGEGGMGEVYKGFNLQTHDPVAIKMIRPELSRDADAMALFKREASTLYTLQHEAIIRYFLFSVDPELQRAYLAMEFVDGVSLARKLGDGPMSPADVGILKSRVAGGLDVAHRLGVVHRDISSDNLILPAGDVRQAKIIDFGIARGPKTSEGTIIGTGFAGKFRYVSPEQLKSGEVTFKSDIYSFGLVLAEALRGKPIDMGNSPHEAVERRRAVPDLSDVDPGFRPLLRSMLQPDPADRPESMAAIAAWAASTGSRGRDGGPRGNSGGGNQRPGVRRGRLAAIAGAVIVVASVATTAYVFRDDISRLPAMLSSDRSTQPAPTKPTSIAVTPTAEANGTATPTPSPTANDDASKPNSQPTDNASASTPPGGADEVVAPPSTSVAMVPPPTVEPSATPESAAGASSGTQKVAALSFAERQSRFLRGFGAGGCAFARADTANPAGLQLLSSDPAASERFAAAYRRELATEPKFTARTIDDPECAVLDLLRAAAASPTALPRIDMDSEEVGTAKPLAGTVQNVGGRHLVLLAIGDDGSVHVVKYAAATDGNSARFSAKLSPDPQDVGHTLALVAIASDQPLKAFETGRFGPASEFIPKLLDESARTDIAVDAKFAKLIR